MCQQLRNLISQCLPPLFLVLFEFLEDLLVLQELVELQDFPLQLKSKEVMKMKVTKIAFSFSSKLDDNLSSRKFFAMI